MTAVGYICRCGRKSPESSPGTHTCPRCNTKANIQRNGDAGYQVSFDSKRVKPPFVVKDGELKRNY